MYTICISCTGIFQTHLSLFFAIPVVAKRYENRGPAGRDEIRVRRSADLALRTALAKCRSRVVTNPRSRWLTVGVLPSYRRSGNRQSRLRDCGKCGNRGPTTGFSAGHQRPRDDRPGWKRTRDVADIRHSAAVGRRTVIPSSEWNRTRFFGHFRFFHGDRFALALPAVTGKSVWADRPASHVLNVNNNKKSTMTKITILREPRTKLLAVTRYQRVTAYRVLTV